MLRTETGYKEIDLSYEYGCVYGYVVDSSAENLENWMEDKGYSKTSLQYIRSNYKRVAIIKNLWMEEEHRGQGYGTKLMEEAIEEAQQLGAKAILLEADTGEQNAFDLVQWYKDVFGFRVVEKENSYPLMIKTL